MDQLIAFHRIFGSCVLGPPQKDYFFAVPWRGSFGRILTMQLEPPKRLLLTLSYFGGGVGLSKFHRDSGTEYFRGCTECPRGVTWRHR